MFLSTQMKLHNEMLIVDQTLNTLIISQILTDYARYLLTPIKPVWRNLI